MINFLSISSLSGSGLLTIRIQSETLNIHQEHYYKTQRFVNFHHGSDPVVFARLLNFCANFLTLIICHMNNTI